MRLKLIGASGDSLQKYINRTSRYLRKSYMNWPADRKQEFTPWADKVLRGMLENMSTTAMVIIEN